MARARPTPRTTRPRGYRGALVLAVGAAIGLTAIGVAGAARRQPEPPPLQRQIEDEIDAMVDAGVPADSPKVELLEEQVDELQRGNRATPRPEPGVDLGERVAEARAAERAEERAPSGAPGAARQNTTRGVPTGPAWDRGVVECEPVPGVLTAEEVADATCVSVPQPDGSNRYVAVGGDGVVRTVAFGDDGAIGRRPDRPLPPGLARGKASFAPTDGGDLRVNVPGRASVTIEVD
ncbi:MAG TPA: hypothetical protein VE575_06350 [Acidimicrobiales bacterium]|jgi:hypothetical protein|nr:hypothetical protein [Acidimicrobiales bacterium]